MPEHTPDRLPAPEHPNESALRKRSMDVLGTTPDVMKNLEKKREEVRAGVGSILDGSAEGALREAQERKIDGKTLEPAQYQAALQLENGKKEVLGQHRFRSHIVPDGKPHPLYIVIGGNSENLVTPNPGDPKDLVFGAQHIFNTLSQKNDSHVLQFVVGDLAKGLSNPKLRNDVALAHIKNLVEDATAGRGQFEGMQVSDVRLFGFSYGANAVQNLVGGKSKADLQGIPVRRTSSLDGIAFGGVTALTKQPSAAPHLNMHQGKRGFVLIKGADMPPRDGQKEDRDVALPTYSHVELTHAHRKDIQENVYAPILEFLRQP